MNKFVRLSLLLLCGLFVSTGVFASEKDSLAPMRDEMGIKEAKAKMYRQKHAKELAAIEKQHEEYLDPEVTEEKLNSYFTNPCKALDWAGEILKSFEGTSGGRDVCLSALDLLPTDTPVVLNVKKFMSMKETKKGLKQGGEETVTHDNVGKTLHQQTLVIQTDEVANVLQFEMTFDLLKGGRPDVKLVLESMYLGVPEALKEQTKGSCVTDKPSITPTEKSSMHVCLFAENSDIPTNTGGTSALRQVFELPDEN